IYGVPPLTFAAEDGYAAIVRLLIGRPGVEIDPTDEYGRTPLLFAARGRPSRCNPVADFEAVMALLLSTNEINVNARERNGRTALSWAAGNGYLARVKALLAIPGIDPNLKDNKGRTPLDWAKRNGHIKVIDFLRMKPIPSDDEDELGVIHIEEIFPDGDSTEERVFINSRN
ncbi:MAG: hypothetical protein M4579_007384, partial [Chaenotheca gracillima]